MHVYRSLWLGFVRCLLPSLVSSFAPPKNTGPSIAASANTNSTPATTGRAVRNQPDQPQREPNTTPMALRAASDTILSL